MENKPKAILVTGCGVSVLCESEASVGVWVLEFLRRGGTPTFKWVDELENVA